MLLNLKDWKLSRSYGVRYWSPQSRNYATVDALFTALVEGWQVSSIVYRTQHWFAGNNRRVKIFVFELYRGSRQMRMPIINNPVLERLLMNPRFVVQRRSHEKKARDSKCKSLALIPQQALAVVTS